FRKKGISAFFSSSQYFVAFTFPSSLSMTTKGPSSDPIKHPHTIMVFRPLLKLGARQSGFILSPALLHTRTCLSLRRISTEHSSLQQTFSHCSSVQLNFFLHHSTLLFAFSLLTNGLIVAG